MTQWSVAQIAETLLGAERRAEPQTSIGAEWDGLDLRAAYDAQDVALRMRISGGQTVTGVKLGVTSRAKQIQVGVDSPSTAWLTDAMILPIGAPVPLGRHIHARAEPEIAFVMGRRLSGPGVSAATALAAVDHVVGAIEIIDSRFSGYEFTMMDAIADNNSSGRYVTGPIGRSPEDLDLALEACLLEVDGEVVDSATGAAVHGHPAEALAFAANTLAERGLAIEPGWVVLTGGMTDAVPVQPGSRIAAHFTSLGSVTVAGE
ncbi:fumarylacetoacetate hydrolase family protein [Rhodococcus sp. BP-252]|uniref:2-keto-4-pentenoate hydratase n=1 Tax=unclassified Rhodococcus (in: high G+C Gram-positive bacteria) TaxID=192944 RepID=UPI001C9A3DB5|nr:MULTISPECIES: fumarylacetoacetate hydrolase family protein [unclassified Rhodococcus (in: high G+C Gram-positive bacteria)]MBY6414374.1 fumarylacetoacetate hydrolase family protein [Rhodococcus sp. BP-320]MBY6419511.1 fumarylacetoacetate hydrolase family protein [Rhodococcus sp. BP-321]MBY6424048.1 fumarylacetoacetate hydrolase family protein [Rhodococcus sp. BP-324]MBY6429259.1 fumarylacetoacetate hydrolase family protein [Rhodococcus sp. BP-323]MBY6434218.1 fumarylacetoacetate hydrolase f